MAGPRRSSRQNTPTASSATNPRSPSSARRGVTPSKSTSTKDSGNLAAPSSSAKKRSSSRGVSPRVSSASKKQERPALPVSHANKQFESYTGKTHKVKLQTLNLGGGGDATTITIARVKCPVPKGVHGHLIKRFDTDAVSASTLFRAAFPTSTEAQEAAEMAWLTKSKKFGDTKQAGAEHDEARKLSGTWVPTKFASALAEDYGITKFAADLIAFKHEPDADTAEVADSEAESPVRAKSPRLAAKRARLASPLASQIPLDAQAGAASHGVSIMQTLTTDPKTGVQQETTEVTVQVPTGDVPQFASNAAEELERSRQLVQQLKEAGTLAELKNATDIPQAPSNKRALEEDEDEEALPTSGTLADHQAPVDTRGFFGKIFRRPPRRPTTASREIRRLGSARNTVVNRDINPEGRRWAAGLGLVVAVGATAIAPFMLG